MDDQDRSRAFWERFYAISPHQTDRPHEDVTVPMLVALLAEVRRETVEASASAVAQMPLCSVRCAQRAAEYLRESMGDDCPTYVRPLAAVAGKWPGDKTDEQLLGAAMREPETTDSDRERAAAFCVATHMATGDGRPYPGRVDTIAQLIAAVREETIVRVAHRAVERGLGPSWPSWPHAFYPGDAQYGHERECRLPVFAYGEWTNCGAAPEAHPPCEWEPRLPDRATPMPSPAEKVVLSLDEYDDLVSERDDCRQRAEKCEAALVKISAIRDSIVGVQGFNFSEHAYPLVAALREAGFEGLPYPEAKENVGTLIERATKAEAEVERLRLERSTPSSGSAHCPHCKGALP